MKFNRFQIQYRDNASKLHKSIGDILKTSNLFSNYKIYQEYPVNKINYLYPNGRHKFDWVILDILLIIEVHGEQHYKPVTFGGITQEKAYDLFIYQKYKDNIKMQAALEAGFTYIAIPFTDINIVDENYIWQLYKKDYNNKQVLKPEKPNETEYKSKIKQLAKTYRQQQYQKQKEYLNKLKGVDSNDKKRHSKNDPGTSYS